MSIYTPTSTSTSTSTPTPTNTRGFSLIELMIALSLGAFICLGVFHLFNTMKNLHQKQMVLSSVQEKMRFLTQFFRDKIQTAGNWSCLSQSTAPRSIVIRKYNAADAQSKLGLTIKSKTDLLQLHECVRLHGKQRYLPIEFFVADTFRANNKKEIYALFYKIDYHPREELITNITHFKIRLYRGIHSKKNTRAVKINYSMSSANDDMFLQDGILYVAKRRD